VAFGGGCLVLIIALTIAHLLQRRTIARERQRQATIIASLRRRRERLAAVGAILPQPLPATATALLPVTVNRRLRVVQRAQQRVPILPRASTPAPAARRVPSAAAELLDALAQLRGELMRLQGRATTSP
jgi:hypothetical protein